MNDQELLKFLRNRLKPRHNRKFLVWWNVYKRKLGFHLHHLLKSTMGGSKINDFFITNVTPEQHHRIHQRKGYEENEFDDMVIEIIETMADYIEHLQEKLNKGERAGSRSDDQ